MKRQINKYINSIRKTKTYSRDYCEEVDEYYFMGDGQGDFEDSSYSASKECTERYIEECLKQIEIAKEYLEKINGND
ncbi:MAG: hypothetical protein WC755_07670 [Candidatus Woesearchaeota archaeon]|jgi:hypothetical protein